MNVSIRSLRIGQLVKVLRLSVDLEPSLVFYVNKSAEICIIL